MGIMNGKRGLVTGVLHETSIATATRAAVAARRLGMDSVLFLRGTEPAQADGNLLIDRLVGARLRGAADGRIGG